MDDLLSSASIYGGCLNIRHLNFLNFKALKVLLHTTVEFIRVKKKDAMTNEKLNTKKVMLVNNFFGETTKSGIHNTEKLLNFFGAFGVPIIFVLFVIVYSITGFSIQYSADLHNHVHD